MTTRRIISFSNVPDDLSLLASGIRACSAGEIPEVPKNWQDLLNAIKEYLRILGIGFPFLLLSTMSILKGRCFFPKWAAATSHWLKVDFSGGPAAYDDSLEN